MNTEALKEVLEGYANTFDGVSAVELVNDAAAELAAMQARIEKLLYVAEELATIIQWAMDDEEDFIYSTEGMSAIAELDALKGDK